jgi:hypothetical protein
MMLYGMKVVVARSTPRYTLPAEVMPGVPWPEGFREETNAWARRVCGETCIVPDDMAILQPAINAIYISPRTYERVRASCIYHQGEFQ